MTGRRGLTLLALGLVIGLGGCVSPAGPVEAVRFVAAERFAELGRGPIRVQTALDPDRAGLEYLSYAAAVERELQRLGYMVVPQGAALPPGAQTATIDVERSVLSPVGNGRGPVSIGVGGGTGGFRSGVGLGVGFNLGGGPKERIATELRAAIRASDGAVLWEGRAMVEAKAGSPMAQTSLNASKLAEGLFTDFPGESGATIRVP
ncbi:hypothetical protein [Blastomonas sp.]|uniref:hypothetical protein n=1 Tax=Blastomonas sp. TaxID=1909299 RepID=UPI0035936824